MATMIRSTTVGTLKSYRTSLNKSFLKQNQARDTVLSQRNFNSCAEDPAAAAQAFQLRRSRMNVESQHSVADSTYRKYQSAWGALLTVVDDVDNQMTNSVKKATLEVLSDTTGDARRALGKELSELADTIVQTMNNKYGESFIFAGADGDNVPFTWEGETLCYRGVPVDASVPNVMKDADGNAVRLDDGSYVTPNASTIRVREFQVQKDPDDPGDLGTLLTVTTEDDRTLNVLEGATSIDEDDYKQLSADDQLSYVKVKVEVTDDDNSGVQYKEVYYKMDDLGSKADYDAEVAANAMTDANGDPYVVNIDGKDYYVVKAPDSTISQADYDEAVENVAKLDYLSRESYYVDIGLGFKENESNELIKSSGFNAALNGISFLGYGTDADGDPRNIVSIIKQMAKICTEDTNSFNWDEFDRLAGKMERAASDLHTMHDDMDAATNKLKNNMGLLEDSFYTLQEQYSGLEDVDMADSITSFVWAQYCYNAALKVGNSILSQSLMDYMN